MLDIEFTDINQGMEKLRKNIAIRDEMGGAMYRQICEDDCLRLANKLSAAGADKKAIAAIGGWELMQSKEVAK